MMLHTDISQAPHVVRAQSVREAKGLFQSGVNVALIEREYPRILREEFQLLNRTLRGEYRGTVTRLHELTDLSQFLEPFCSSRATAQIVLAEIKAIVHDFMELSGQTTLQMIFGQITTDHCRLFHDDKNHLRLVCTFTGKGTEWLMNEDVHRAGLGTGTNAGHIEGRPIQRLRPYDIAIMKGDLYPGNAGNGLVHRSPPMGTTPEDEARIFLALDSLGREVSSKNEKRFRWQIAEPSAEGIFCREVRARYEKSLKSLM